MPEEVLRAYDGVQWMSDGAPSCSDLTLLCISEQIQNSPKNCAKVSFLAM